MEAVRVHTCVEDTILNSVKNQTKPPSFSHRNVSDGPLTKLTELLSINHKIQISTFKGPTLLC